MKLTIPLKTHGGKADLAKWIISLMPPRCRNPNKPDPKDKGWLHYVEPYFGGGAVLLANDPIGISEVVNDLNGELINFWTVMQNSPLFDKLARLVTMTPFSKAEWQAAKAGLDNHHVQDSFDYNGGVNVVRAAWFFIFCRQSLAGRMKGFTGITKTRTRRGMNNEVSAWLTAIDGLPAIHERLKRVLILNDEALNVIKSQDGPRTLFYLDPPYLHETRATTGEYKHEMDKHAHVELLTQLKTIKGRFLLSGYHSPLYDRVAAAQGWTYHEKKINNHAAGGKKKSIMTEVIWSNF